MKKSIFFFSFIFLFFVSCDTVLTDLDSTVDTEITSDYLLDETDLTTYMGEMEVVRLKGKPGVTVFDIGTGDLSGYKPCFILYIATGEESTGTVSSAIIKFDGVEILNTSDFSGDVYKEYKFEICDLDALSTLEVEIRGEPGSYLDIWINGKPLGEDPFTGDAGTFTDSRDNHVYNWVRIGEQIWMAENLAYLPTINDAVYHSDTDPRYYVYDYSGDIAAAKVYENYTTYGVLYNWPAATLETTCPEGWHLSTQSEWSELSVFAGGDAVAGDKLKEVGTDDYGFTALPGGIYDANNLSFCFIRDVGRWWAPESPSSPENVYLFDEASGIYYRTSNKDKGYSIRCVKD